MSHSKDKGMKTLFSFYPKKDVTSGASSGASPSVQDGNSAPKEQDERQSKQQKIDDMIKRDPALRQAIWKYPYKEQDEVRRRYIGMGPCQPKLQEYKRNDEGRCFRYEWFKAYNWMEYSESLDRAYCFPCFLFDANTPQQHKQSAWVSEGFNSWKRVGGKDSSVKLHEGGPSSHHANNIMMLESFKSPSQSIENQLTAQCEAELKRNRLRLTTTIDAILLLSCQGCALRGHDESVGSKNRGNLIELLKYTAKLSPQVAEIILENAPGNAMYTSSLIQNQLMDVMGDQVRMQICQDIGDSKFCILIDESQDESNCEQMSIVLRFVDGEGFIRERFFDVVEVEDTSAQTLKTHCSAVLDRNGLLVQNIRGQGYDGASNMRGAWKGLQALYLQECPYAYYVHCFAHQLQLSLVAASGEVSEIELFFQMLNCIVNMIRASPKRNQQLKAAQKEEIEDLLKKGELQTSQGGNQRSSLRQSASTRWGSQYTSASSLRHLYKPSCEVLEIIGKEGLSRKIRAEATGALAQMSSFHFVFILHLMIEVMGITEVLSQNLQRRSQDILSGMNSVLVTKTLLLELKNDDKWQSFLQNVILFCKKYEIDTPEMSARYMKGTRRTCQQIDEITIEHHYRVDILYETVNTQVMELNERFTDSQADLLHLCSALDPKDSLKALNIDDVCMLAKKYYPGDFSEIEINYQLRHQLQHYERHMHLDPDIQKISTLPLLCQKLAQTGKSETYYLVDRLVRLVLTLPVSTASTERSFSAMKNIKTRLRNKMGSELLANHMIIYIERDISEYLDRDAIIKEFRLRGNRRMNL